MFIRVMVHIGMDTLEMNLRAFLSRLSDTEDDEKNTLFLEGCGLNLNAITRLGSARSQLENLYDVMQNSHVDPDVVLAGVVDDETYAMYEEIDKILEDAEAVESHSAKSRAQIAKILVSCLMRVDQVENMHQLISGCFQHSQTRNNHEKYINSDVLTAGLDMLGWHVSPQQAREIISETDSCRKNERMRTSVTELLTNSSSFRSFCCLQMDLVLGQTT